MSFEQLLDLQEKLETRANRYWAFWSAVVLAILGWLFSSYALTSYQAIALLLGAAVFFFSNLAVIWSTTRMAVGVQDELRIAAESQAFKSPLLRAALGAGSLERRLPLTVALHLGVDAPILLLIAMAALST